MKGRLWVAGLALALLSAPGARGQSVEHDEVEQIEAPERVPEQKADTAKAARQIIEQTNAFRKDERRAAVTVSKELTAAAEAFARYMAEKDRYGHTADGRRPSDRAKKQGYEYCIVLENIAYQYSSLDFETEDLAKRFVRGWEKSPGHRRNMLDPDVTQTGVGVARSEKTGHYYAVQMFGRPKSLAITFRIANRSEADVEYTVGERKFTIAPNYTRTHTRCRPAEVKFTPAAKGKEGTTVKPADGDRFVITTDGDGYAVKKE